MFTLLLIIFAAFLGIFGFLTWASIYHLRQYAPEGFGVVNIVTSIFLLITVTLFIFAVYFFLQITQ